MSTTLHVRKPFLLYTTSAANGGFSLHFDCEPYEQLQMS